MNQKFQFLNSDIKSTENFPKSRGKRKNCVPEMAIMKKEILIKGRY